MAVTLRALTVSDADVMTHVLGSPSLYTFIGGTPPTIEELRQRYEVQTRGSSADGSETWLNFIVVDGGSPAGYVQATITGDTAEIAWVIGAEFQGRGLGSTGAQLLCSELAIRGVHQILAHIHPDNAASEKIARRLGMKPTDIWQDGERRFIGTNC